MAITTKQGWGFTMYMRSIAIALSLAVAGISGYAISADRDEPTRADLISAIEHDIASHRARLPITAPGAQNATIHQTALHDVDKLACNRQTSPLYPGAIYRCTLNVDMTVPFVGRTAKPVTTIVTRFNKGWMLISL